MKKDTRLEGAFDEYFEGAQPPKASVTDAAKNSIAKKKSLPAPIQRALIAAASVLSACASAVGLYFAPATIGGIIDSGDRNDTIVAQPDNPQSGEATAPDNPQSGNYYALDELTARPLNAYADETPEGLGFVKTLNLAENCSLESYTAYSDGESTALIKAEFTASINLVRHETVVYAEYTGGKTCEIFRDFAGGKTANYHGYAYTYFDTEANGEPVKNIALANGGIKYYLSVTSSDEYAYTVWLDTVCNNF